MDLVLRPATEADRDSAHRLLTAQLIEHRLPADPDGVARGIDLALAPHSPAWLWLGQREGRTVVPLQVYFNEKGRAKIEIALAKGKQAHDKRQTIKDRDWQRQRSRLLSHR